MRQRQMRAAWRGSEWSAPRNLSAGDIVRYEEDDLHNSLGIPLAVTAELDHIPSSRMLWVTRTRSAARRYGSAEPVVLGDHHIVLSENDGDDGFLVLDDRRRLTRAALRALGIEEKDCE